MNQTRELRLLNADGSESMVIVEISTEPTCSITLLTGEEGSRVYEARDLFEALVSLRLDLEKRQILIACNGARKDVFPSGMARSMSSGLKAYVLKPGRHAVGADVVDVFDPATAELGSVKEQQDYFNAWRDGDRS